MQFPPPNAHLLPADIPCVPVPIPLNAEKSDKIRGSMLGLAVGDALGASVEFMTYNKLQLNPVYEMLSGGTWGLDAGEWTDDTSMALCFAASLITRKSFDPYNQMVYYKWWYKYGFLSSRGHCFDIGKATREALDEFSRRQKRLGQTLRLSNEIQVDRLTYEYVKQVPSFNVFCGRSNVAGNGALMRLAPVALYYFRNPAVAVELAGISARLTHGSDKAIDACRYYAALIVAVLHGETKEQLLSEGFYNDHRHWFSQKPLCPEIRDVARGSYKRSGGHHMGIRGTGYVVQSLEAALWAFWSDGDSFQRGVLNAVNLGDDTDTTAAIYGQLAGAYYGERSIPKRWLQQLYARKLIVCISDWLHYLGQQSYYPMGDQHKAIVHPVPKPLRPTLSAPSITTRAHIAKNVTPSQVTKAMNNQFRIHNPHIKNSLWKPNPSYLTSLYQNQNIGYMPPHVSVPQYPYNGSSFIY